MLESDLQVSAFNHSFSFSSALPRWLTAFLSFFGISAYVRPSYSKHESQPKSVGPLDGTSLPYIPWSASNANFIAVEAAGRLEQRRRGKTYVCPSLKDDHVLSRPLAIRKRANRLRALVFEAGEELVEVFRAEGFQKPFATIVVSCSAGGNFGIEEIVVRTEAGAAEERMKTGKEVDLHIRPRQLAHSIKTETCVLHQHRSFHL